MPRSRNTNSVMANPTRVILAEPEAPVTPMAPVVPVTHAAPMAPAALVAPVVPVAPTVHVTPIVPVSQAEKPEKFSGTNFKRWQQKMLFYLTTLHLARYLYEEAPKQKKGFDSCHSRVIRNQQNLFPIFLLLP